MHITLSNKARKIGLILGSIAVFLALQSLFNEFLIDTFVGHESESLLAQILNLFSVNLEESLPTWYSTILLLMAAGLIGLIAVHNIRNQERYAWYWAGLSIIFIYLSMDEGVAIHEILSEPLHQLFHTSGYFSFGWQVAAIPFVGILGALYLRFVINLPARTRTLFIIAGCLYIGGALVIESVSANLWELNGGISLFYLAVGTLEELCEMLGIVVFIYALISHMTQHDMSFAFLASESSNPMMSQDREKAKNTGSYSSLRVRLIVFGTMGLIFMNLGFLYLANTYQETSPLTPTPQQSVYDVLIDQYADSDLTITHLNYNLTLNDLPNNALIRSLSENYPSLMIVSLPTQDSSIIFASENLPFDHTELAAILSNNAINGYLILDTQLVKALLSSQ